MTTWVAQPATEEQFVLGEGPVWDATRERLLWVDIVRGLVLEGVLEGDRIRVTARHEFPQTVGAVAVAADGSLLVAAHGHLVVVDGIGDRSDGPRVVPSGQDRRLNDGTPDPVGRYLVGTRAFGPSTSEELVLIGADGSVNVIDDDLTLANGLAWSPDGALLYTVDTLIGDIWVRDYDVATGATGERRLFVHVTDGYPDGICTDSEGHVWVAIWSRGEVRRLDPRGEVVGTVIVPAPHTSSVAFAGPDLDVLVITTATDELDDASLAAYPDSGRLFVAHVGIAGTPVAHWDPAT